MNSEVRKALDELTATHPDLAVTHEDDGQGGAWVKVDDVYIGAQYEPETTWIAFQINYLCPDVDVYPHFVRPDLQRKDGQRLGDAFQSRPYGPKGVPAIQVSRRTNAHTPLNTPVIKLGKVIDWMREQ